MEAFEQLKKYAIVVYLNIEDQKSLEAVSPVVVGGFFAKAMGNTIPKAVVTSADQRTHVTSMAYDSMKSEKSFREVNKSIKSALNGEAVEPPKDSPPVWLVSGNGEYYEGEFVEVRQNTHLVFRKGDGKTHAVPLAELSEGTRAYLTAAGGAEIKAEVEKEEFKIEDWTNTAGKAIQGKFVSLSGSKITLEKADGKSVTFDLSLLSEASQTRAKELAAK